MTFVVTKTEQQDTSGIAGTSGAGDSAVLVDILPHGTVLTEKGLGRSQALVSSLHAALPAPMTPLAIAMHLRSRTPFVFLNLTATQVEQGGSTGGPGSAAAAAATASPAEVVQAVFRAVRAGSGACGDRPARKAYFKLSSNWGELPSSNPNEGASSTAVRYGVTAKGVDPVNGRETTRAFVLQGGGVLLSSQQVKNDLAKLSSIFC
jgi:hypothetical protein